MSEDIFLRISSERSYHPFHCLGVVVVRPSHCQGPHPRGLGRGWKDPHLGFFSCWPSPLLGAKLESILTHATVWPQREMWSFSQTFYLPDWVTVRSENLGILNPLGKLHWNSPHKMGEGGVRGDLRKYILLWQFSLCKVFHPPLLSKCEHIYTVFRGDPAC